MAQDMLSTRRLLGGGGQEIRAQHRSGTAATFTTPAAVRERLEFAFHDGLHSMVSVGDARLFAAVGPKPAASLPQILPIVPNIQGFMREAVEHGIIGAGFNRVRRMGFASLMGLGLRGVTRGPSLLKRDFPTMLLCFIELELADFKRFDPPRVFLQAQITDLALAMNNPRILEVFVSAVKRLTHAEPGFMTVNFGMLAAKCKEWGLPLTGVVAPWEASGAGMRPSRALCETALKESGCELWADRSGRISSPSATEHAYLDSCGVKGSLRDDDALLGGPHLPHPAEEAACAEA